MLLPHKVLFAEGSPQQHTQNQQPLHAAVSWEGQLMRRRSWGQARAVSGQERMGSGAKMTGFALEAGQVLLETVEEVECTCPDAGGWEVVVVDGSL